MKNKGIATEIQKIMGKVHGGQAGPFKRRHKEDLSGYGQDLYEWARAVRRDILVLEQHLMQMNRALTTDDFYRDPGDPPPPPD